MGSPIDPEVAPARAAVVLLSDGDNCPILLATTADARAFLRKRLGSPGARVGPTAEPDGVAPRRAGPRADLGAIVRRAEITLVGSGLEADLAFLSIARAAMPQTWEALTDRWRAWFIHLDPEAPNPVWRKTNLGDVGPGQHRPTLGHLVGPIATKDTAGRFGEALDDLFDLCRFPKELAAAPRGTACAYKEMGKCPAPCDGSEPMPAYRLRVRDALQTLRLEPDQRAGSTEARMQDAAARQDFESAALHKSRLDRLAQIAKPSMREARPLDTFAFLAILGSGRAGWARAWLIDPFTCHPVVDLDGAQPRQSIRQLAEVLRPGSEARPGAKRDELDPARRLDPVLLGIVGKHLLAPGAKRRGGFIRLPVAPLARDAELFDHALATRLLRAAARTDTPDVDEFDRATSA